MVRHDRDRPVKVLCVASFPVQYASPQFVRYSEDARLDVTVIYDSLRGVEPAVDPEFGVAITWDVPLLDGYRWIGPAGRSGSRTERVLGFPSLGVWRLVREGRFDVVVCYGHRSLFHWTAALAARASGAKLVWSSDATRLQPRPGASGQRWKPAVKQVLLPLIYGWGQGVLTPSTKGRRFMSSLGVSPRKVFLTPFAVDTEFFERGSAKADPVKVRQGWKVPEHAFVALFCGKLAPWKRPMDLLEAISRAPGVVAVFAGDGELRGELERRARLLGLDERIRWLGFVNQSSLPATYRAADVLVLPSEHEPFGLVVNESFASGTPAVATTACGVSGDLLSDNETGFTYPSGDVPALAERLRRLQADPALRDRFAEAARARVAGWGLEENAESFAIAMTRIAGRSR
jgi:glycosyltransferase involved in cell wall biosynthesis